MSGVGMGARTRSAPEDAWGGADLDEDFAKDLRILVASSRICLFN